MLEGLSASLTFVGICYVDFSVCKLGPLLKELSLNIISNNLLLISGQNSYVMLNFCGGVTVEGVMAHTFPFELAALDYVSLGDMV